MPRLPVLTMALAVVLTACGGSDAPRTALGPLADQADRVAELIDEGRGCDAVDALADLRSLAEQDVPVEVRDAVVGFTSSAEQAVACETSSEAPAPDPPEAEDDEDEDGDHPGRGNGKGKGKGKGSDD